MNVEPTRTFVHPCSSYPLRACHAGTSRAENTLSIVEAICFSCVLIAQNTKQIKKLVDFFFSWTKILLFFKLFDNFVRHFVPTVTSRLCSKFRASKTIHEPINLHENKTSQSMQRPNHQTRPIGSLRSEINHKKNSPDQPIKYLWASNERINQSNTEERHGEIHT